MDAIRTDLHLSYAILVNAIITDNLFFLFRYNELHLLDYITIWIYYYIHCKIRQCLHKQAFT